MSNDYNLTVSLPTDRLTGAINLDAACRELTPGFVGAIRTWYSSNPESWFDGPEHPPDRPRSYMRGIIAGWHEGTDSHALHAVFMSGSDTHYGLRLHQYGGTIRPVTRKALTIPIDPRARSVRAREFESIVGSRLFIVRGSAERAILAWRDGDTLRPAYALRKSSRVPSLRERRGYDALPSKDELAAIARDLFLSYIQAMTR